MEIHAMCFRKWFSRYVILAYSVVDFLIKPGTQTYLIRQDLHLDYLLAKYVRNSDK